MAPVEEWHIICAPTLAPWLLTSALFAVMMLPLMMGIPHMMNIYQLDSWILPSHQAKTVITSRVNVQMLSLLHVGSQTKTQMGNKPPGVPPKTSRRRDRSGLKGQRRLCTQVVQELQQQVERSSTGGVMCDALQILLQYWPTTPQISGSEQRALEAAIVTFGDTLCIAIPRLSREQICQVADLLTGVRGKHKIFDLYFANQGAQVLELLGSHAIHLQLAERQIARLIWAFGKAQGARPELLQTLLSHLVHRMDLHALTAPDISMAAYGLAKAQVNDELSLERLADHITLPGVMHQFEAQAVANTAWAMATLGFQHSRLMDTMAHHIMEGEVFMNFTAQAIANVAWAYATLGIPNEALFLSLARRALQPDVLDTFNAQNVANLAWAFAKCGVRHHALMAALAHHTLKEEVLATFLPQNIANLLWSFAKLRMKHTTLNTRLAQHIMASHTWKQFSPQAVANTVWAFATLNHRDEELMAAMASQAASPAFLNRGLPQHVANVVWAFATLDVQDERLLKTLSRWMLQGKCLADFNAQELSNVAWAFATLKVYDRHLLNAIADYSLKPHQLASFTPQHVANMAWAFATLSLLPEALMSEFIRLTTASLASTPCHPRNAINVIWATTWLGVPDVSLIDAVAQKVLGDPEFLAAFNVQDLTNFAWAMAVAQSQQDDAIALVLGAIYSALQSAESAESRSYRQIHSLNIHVALHPNELPSSNHFLDHHPKFKAECQAHFFMAAQQTTRSYFHGSVVEALQHLGVQVEEEAMLRDGAGYTADILLPSHRLVLEVDGPSHFITTAKGRQPSGSTLLKRQQLSLLGYQVVSIPFYEWDGRSPTSQLQYIRSFVLPNLHST